MIFKTCKNLHQVSDAELFFPNEINSTIPLLSSIFFFTVCCKLQLFFDYYRFLVFKLKQFFSKIKGLLFCLFVLVFTSHLSNFYSYGVEEIPHVNFPYFGIKFLIASFLLLFNCQSILFCINFTTFTFGIFFLADQDDKEHCFSNCYMKSDLPSNSEYLYELETMTITFTRFVTEYVLKRPCGKYNNHDFDVEFACEGKFIYGNTVIFLF